MYGFNAQNISLFCDNFIVVTVCWTGLFDFHSIVDERTNEDLTQSFSDSSRGLPQRSHSTQQSVFSNEYLRFLKSSQFTCDVCNKKFTSFSELETHLHVHEFTCQCCDKIFTHVAQLDHHMRIHTGSFVCEVCTKNFKGPGDLKRHMNIHAGMFACEVCGKKFGWQSHLKNHLRAHVR